MIHFLHLGMGGRYKTYVAETVRRINRHRPSDLSSHRPSFVGHRVAVCHLGEPLTQDRLANILRHDVVTFVFGDSNGMPSEEIERCHDVVSVSSLPTVNHQMEVAIVAEAVDMQLSKEVCLA